MLEAISIPFFRIRSFDLWRGLRYPELDNKGRDVLSQMGYRYEFDQEPASDRARRLLDHEVKENAWRAFIACQLTARLLS